MTRTRSMARRLQRPLAAGSMLAMLAACAAGPIPVPVPPARAQLNDGVIRATDGTPAPATTGNCWASESLVLPAPRGAAQGATPAIAEPVHFRIPCPEVMTPDLIAALQRALAARGYYKGDASGRMNTATHAAIRAWQAPLGLDSGTLSLRGAQTLGLIISDEAAAALARLRQKTEAAEAAVPGPAAPKMDPEVAEIIESNQAWEAAAAMKAAQDAAEAAAQSAPPEPATPDETADPAATQAPLPAQQLPPDTSETPAP